MVAMQEYAIQVDDVPDGMGQAFQEMVQNQSATMARLSQEQRKTAERIEELERENKSLQARNAELAGEVAALRGRGAAPPLGVGAQPRPEAPRPGGEPFELVRKIMVHEGPVHSVTTGAARGTVATASWDGTVKIYDLAREEVVTTLAEYDRGQPAKMLGLYDVAFAKTADDILGCTSCDHSVYLWNHRERKLEAKLTGHKNEVNSIDFHSSQQVMATASDDNSVIIWDFQEGIVLRTLDRHTKAVYGTTFLGQENQYLLATCCFDQKTRIWDMRDKQVVALLAGHTDDVIGIDYSPSKQLLATGSDDGLVCVWDTRKWKLHQKVSTRASGEGAEDNEVKRVAFSPDGELLAAACSSSRVLVYDVLSLGGAAAGGGEGPVAPYATLTGHVDCVFDVTMGVDQHNVKYLVSASHDHNCFYWRHTQG